MTYTRYSLRQSNIFYISFLHFIIACTHFSRSSASQLQQPALVRDICPQALRDICGVCARCACAENIAYPVDIFIAVACPEERHIYFFHHLAFLKYTYADDEVKLIVIGDKSTRYFRSAESIIADIDKCFRRCEIAADARICKGIAVYSLYHARIADRDFRKRSTAVKGIIRYLDYIIRENDISQLAATEECTLINACKSASLFKFHRFKVTALRKCIIIYRDNRGGYRDLFQVLCTVECTITERKYIGGTVKYDAVRKAVFKCAETDDLG